MTDMAALSGRQAFTQGREQRAESMGVREALRRATGASHLRLHEQPDMCALQAGTLSREAYGALLQSLWQLHYGFERAIVAHAGDLALHWYGSPPGASRLERLAADLLALGLPVAGAAHLTAFASPTEALGCAWVLEGSAMGGRLMAKGLAGVLGADAVRAGSFFLPTAAPMADRTRGQATRWSQCLRAVESSGETEAGRTGMIVGATNTFAAFERVLGMSRLESNIASDCLAPAIKLLGKTKS